MMASGIPAYTRMVSATFTADNLPAQSSDHRLYSHASGCRCAHGRAVSTCADSESSEASSAGRPTSMLPIGNPASVQYSGTLTAGCPVTLNSAVKAA